MIILSTLSQVSGFFFILGLVSGRLASAPISIASPFFQILALVFHLCGYSLWFIGSYFEPEHSYDKKKWYGFAPIKTQYLFAATLGLIATLVNMMGILIPVLLICASWIFLISSILWSIGEYHKLKDPPSGDEYYSYACQKVYLSYTICLLAINGVTAISATAIALLPLLVVPISVLSGMIISGLSALVAQLWLEYNFGYNQSDASLQPLPSLQPLKLLQNSYDMITKTLDSKKDKVPMNNNVQQQLHQNDLFLSPMKESSVELLALKPRKPEINHDHKDSVFNGICSDLYALDFGQNCMQKNACNLSPNKF